MQKLKRSSITSNTNRDRILSNIIKNFGSKHNEIKTYKPVLRKSPIKSTKRRIKSRERNYSKDSSSNKMYEKFIRVYLILF